MKEGDAFLLSAKVRGVITTTTKTTTTTIVIIIIIKYP
jgi:hypothetical protein